ncbi:MarR family winged helix-turn-helix transcriptional regulator [Chryseobacterium tongliaoense]|uniref:MarR family winged helix-turn-helix transcriptional regulator n=1 Tax=Chryseobacterium tongliaoense TaxID=3240933 RepID=UPI003519A15B
MNKTETEFYHVFTDLQCYILAHMNKGDIRGVTATHYNIIEYLYRNNNTTGKQIAKAFNISQAAISRQLKFLVEKKLIEQQQSEKDRRVFNLSVTTAGKNIIDNSENFRESTAKTIGHSLTKSEFEDLIRLMQKMMSVVYG